MEQQKRKMIPQVEAYNLAKQTLNELYATDDGRKFVHHLIYAFNAGLVTPILFSKPVICDCLSKSVLTPVSTKDNPAPQELIDLHNAWKVAEEQEVKDRIHQDLTLKLSKYVMDSKLTRVALHTDYSNKILGLDELQALFDFINDQIKDGNEVIQATMHVLKPDLYKSPKRKSKSKLNKAKASDTSDEYASKLNDLIQKYRK